MNWVAIIVASSPLTLYIAARLIFAAYFFTKHQFDNKRKQHGTQQQRQWTPGSIERRSRP